MLLFYFGGSQFSTCPTISVIVIPVLLLLMMMMLLLVVVMVMVMVADEQFSFSVGSFCSFYLPTFSSICQWHSGCFFLYVFFPFLSTFHFSHSLARLILLRVRACLRVSQCALFAVCLCVCLILHFRFIRLFIILGWTEQKYTKNLQRVSVCEWVLWTHRGD